MQPGRNLAKRRTNSVKPPPKYFTAFAVVELLIIKGR